MQQFVGEEKNELLDYLRSLLPEKVMVLFLYNMSTVLFLQLHKKFIL